MKIENIKIADIDDFENHPFHVKDDEDMASLMESIRQNGVLSPIIVRPKENGRYEMISGHRRKHACELLGIDTIPATVSEMSREEAVIRMVDSNCHRSVILPSEKAFSYKMKYDALKHQGKTTSGPADQKSSLEAMSENGTDSVKQIQRYIRLTNLIPELLEYVDNGQMKMRPAVELSYVDEEAQRDVVDRIEEEQAFPSHDQAIRLRRAFEEGYWSYKCVRDIMSELKPNQRNKLTISSQRVLELIPEGLTPEETEDFLYKAVYYLRKALQKQREGGR